VIDRRTFLGAAAGAGLGVGGMRARRSERSRLELVLNLRAANALGLAISQPLLLRAEAFLR
jgi:hypothetical protein